MKTKNLAIFAVTYVICFSSIVFAVPPGAPHQFFGTVSINGAPAPDGTTISTKIGGAFVASTITSGGKYGYSPNIFYIDDPNSNLVGSSITFFVNGVDTGVTAYFENFKSTQLNLAATIAVSPSLPSGSGSGGGGAPSSGGGVPSTPITKATNKTPDVSTTSTNISGPCVERWTCDTWSACTDGLQKRKCTDANKCGTIENLPMTSQPCSKEEARESEIKQKASQPGLFSNLISGFMVSAASPTGAGLILAVIVVLSGGYYLTRKGSSKKSKVPVK